MFLREILAVEHSFPTRDVGISVQLTYRWCMRFILYPDFRSLVSPCSIRCSFFVSPCRISYSFFISPCSIIYSFFVSPCSIRYSIFVTHSIFVERYSIFVSPCGLRYLRVITLFDFYFNTLVLRYSIYVSPCRARYLSAATPSPLCLYCNCCKNHPTIVFRRCMYVCRIDYSSIALLALHFPVACLELASWSDSATAPTLFVWGGLIYQSNKEQHTEIYLQNYLQCYTKELHQ